MDELRELYEELRRHLAPKGFFASTADLDILVYEYTAGIAGHVSSYLGGKQIDPSSVYFDEELDRRLEECLSRLNELKSYKNKYDVIARQLIITQKEV